MFPFTVRQTHSSRPSRIEAPSTLGEHAVLRPVLPSLRLLAFAGVCLAFPVWAGTPPAAPAPPAAAPAPPAAPKEAEFRAAVKRVEELAAGLREAISSKKVLSAEAFARFKESALAACATNKRMDEWVLGLPWANQRIFRG